MLTVYRASAGAGKTHRLTGEYLKLLFSQPNAYRHILAVTFTNKAADEMKERIIRELYKLAAGKKSDYIKLLTATYNQTEEEIRKLAKKNLTAILHDYAAFNISTIDKFFQQTMRAFTREIGLQGGYGIEMDQERVLSEAIDNLLADLEKPESKELLGWLLRFAEEKIENGGEWNLRRDMMMLSREIFKESYKVFSDAVKQDIENKTSLEEYKNDLYTIIRQVEKEARQLGEKGLAVLNRYGLKPSDFKNGSRSPIYQFEKLAKGEFKEPTATFINLADCMEGCYTKTTPEAMVSIICCAFQDGLNDCIKGVVSLFSDLKAYYTAKEIIRYYYTLGILTDISHQIAMYREEKNIMLIADTTELLNKVIDGNDIPFVYEKTGTTIDHYMIDEFQDTSGMQWSNFLPLIKESLAYKKNNLIVGDVKQSIYRFRNSDWKLLDEQVQRDFDRELVKEETLKDNWRSCRNIVEFNNSLFTVSPALLQAMYNEPLTDSPLSEKEKEVFSTKIMSAYQQSTQRVPIPFQKKEGHVRIDFLKAEEAADWEEEALQKLPATLEQLQDKGYALKDIAILVRTNVEGALVADTLLTYKEEHPSGKYHYDIISDDALFVSSSASVRFIIALLRHLKNPDDPTCRHMTLFAYNALKGRIETGSPEAGFTREQQQILYDLSHNSLYETTEGIYRLFREIIPENEQVFIQAFLDMVSEYALKETSDLNRFLKWWEETGRRKTIATPDGQNAIRILTIHKSKGLGFKAVILPFGDWEIDHKPTKPVILWCRPGEKPFNRLNLVPIRYSQNLSKTIFAKEYFHERLHAFIDNLNTLYVALTRAKEELILFSPHPKKLKSKTREPEKITCIGDLLWASLCIREEAPTEQEQTMDLPACFHPETGSFEVGNHWLPATGTDDPQAVQEIPIERIHSISPDERLKLRLYGKGFFINNPRKKYSSIAREILSHIYTKEDIPRTIGNYQQAGIVNEEESRLLHAQIEQWISQPETAPWFDPSCQVLKEPDILTNKKTIKHPDRIVIKDQTVTVVNYKFGEKKEKRHQGQIRNYMKLIHEMGYQEVKGYLWYVERNEIECV